MFDSAVPPRLIFTGSALYCNVQFNREIVVVHLDHNASCMYVYDFLNRQGQRSSMYTLLRILAQVPESFARVFS